MNKIKVISIGPVRVTITREPNRRPAWKRLITAVIVVVPLTFADFWVSHGSAIKYFAGLPVVWLIAIIVQITRFRWGSPPCAIAGTSQADGNDGPASVKKITSIKQAVTTPRMKWSATVAVATVALFDTIHAIRWQATVAGARASHETVTSFLVGGSAVWALIVGFTVYAAARFIEPRWNRILSAVTRKSAGRHTGPSEIRTA